MMKRPLLIGIWLLILLFLLYAFFSIQNFSGIFSIILDPDRPTSTRLLDRQADQPRSTHYLIKSVLLIYPAQPDFLIKQQSPHPTLPYWEALYAKTLLSARIVSSYSQ